MHETKGQTQATAAQEKYSTNISALFFFSFIFNSKVVSKH